MVDFTALVAKWPSISGSTLQEQIDAINALTVAGPNINVQPSQVVRYLALNLKLAGIMKYAASPPATLAGTCAAELVAILNMGQNAPPFYTSDPTDFAALQAMLNALAGDADSGITTPDVTALLALAETAMPWWQASVANGGGGLDQPVGLGYLVNAGLVTH